MAGYLDNFIQNYAAIAAPLYQLTRKETKCHGGKQEEEAFRKIQDTISSAKTMAFFDPSKPIILRTEASFNEGLSAALLQKTDRGIQPIHFISRTMTEAEKRYSQTEKDALAIKWAKERHPLPEAGHDKTEKIIRWNVNTEHAVVVTRIREETQKDEVMQRLAKRIAKGDWEKHKRDKDLKPYLHVK